MGADRDVEVVLVEGDPELRAFLDGAVLDQLDLGGEGVAVGGVVPFAGRNAMPSIFGGTTVADARLATAFPPSRGRSGSDRTRPGRKVRTNRKRGMQERDDQVNCDRSKTAHVSKGYGAGWQFFADEVAVRWGL